ncbi:hypothetical protein F9L07_02800 [Pimelobacter simplex]|uniref:Uncharacterized protein n=1 Tax=Nocardioides simplex TaxID=2045 RepID=A0A7J5DY30_NOCSI|nr:hypothetical protein F9L07_02800 [Pimelobacter simplex]
MDRTGRGERPAGAVGIVRLDLQQDAAAEPGGGRREVAAELDRARAQGPVEPSAHRGLGAAEPRRELLCAEPGVVSERGEQVVDQGRARRRRSGLVAARKERLALGGRADPEPPPGVLGMDGGDHPPLDHLGDRAAAPGHQLVDALADLGQARAEDDDAQVRRPGEEVDGVRPLRRRRALGGLGRAAGGAAQQHQRRVEVRREAGRRRPDHPPGQPLVVQPAPAAGGGGGVDVEDRGDRRPGRPRVDLERVDERQVELRQDLGLTDLVVEARHAPILPYPDSLWWRFPACTAVEMTKS